MSTGLFAIRDITPASHPNGLHAFWVESTAPLVVDSGAPPEADPSALQNAPSLEIAGLVALLQQYTRPRIVVDIHGFNNSKADAFGHFSSGVNTLVELRETSPPTEAQDAIFYLGYCWPSEKMGSTRSSVLSAMPVSLSVLYKVLMVLTAVFLVAFVVGYFLGQRGAVLTGGLLAALFAFLIGIPITLILCRVVVYFRDNYRAIYYAVPDLVEVLRQIDVNLAPTDGSGGLLDRPARIPLSVIGHSLGALVTTATVRTLSDVFSPASVGSSRTNDADKEPGGNIGHVYTLSELVLVSPDIPGEALLMGRANNLSSSLRRFDKAYLFSNEGDVVVGMISTIASYFSFPTMSSRYGQRLANVNVRTDTTLPQRYGIVNGDAVKAQTFDIGEYLSIPLLGDRTLLQLGGDIMQTKDGALADVESDPVADAFTFIDCTDYIPAVGKPGVLTFSLQKASLSDADDRRLLIGYAQSKVDVHSGYFHPESVQTRMMIYGLAGHGMAGVLRYCGNGVIDPGAKWAALDRLAAEHRIQILLSPRLYMPQTYSLEKLIRLRAGSRPAAAPHARP